MPQQPDPAHVAHAMADLRARARKHRTAQGADAKRSAREALHQAIVAAVGAGVTQVKVSQVSGLSKAQVSRIARGGSSGRSLLPPAQYLIDTLPTTQLIQRYQAGESTSDLGQAFGCSRTTISDVLKAAGVPRDHRAGRPAIVLPHGEVMERYARGESVRSIARSYGVSHMTILRRVRQEEVRHSA